LNDPNAEVRRIAVGVVASFPDCVSASELSGALFDCEWQVRREAAIALSRFSSDESTTTLLVRALEDEYWQVTKEAIQSLGQIKANIPHPIRPYGSHAVADVRIATAVALGEMRATECIADLKSLSEDPDTGVQKAARRALEQINSPGKVKT
jgi:HEAT repeat protein